jgi:protein O-mannosyl-transferase
MAKQRSKANKRNKTKTNKGRSGRFYFLAGILLLTVIVYSGAMRHDFIYQFDDDLYVTNNPDIQALTAENFGKIFTNTYVGLYLPITMATYMLEYSAFGPNPMPYHLTNLIIHLINTVLVFMLIIKIRPGTYLASIVAFVFALHPMHAESVTWISERKDVLYALFYLAGLLSWLYYIQKKTTKIYLLTIFFFILSLFSKTVAVSFPLFLVIFDWYFGRPLWSKKVILEKIPFFALSLAVGLLGIYMAGTANDTSTPDIPWIYRPFIISDAVMIYIYKFIAPFKLMIYYYYPDLLAGNLPTKFYISTVALLVVFTATVFWAVQTKTKQRDLLLGILFFVIPTLFVLQLIPLGRAYAAERYTYLSYIGLAYIFGIFTRDIVINNSRKNLQLKAILIGILIFFGVGFSALTWTRNHDWQDSFSLFDDLIDKNPDHGHPYLIRGITHIQFGNPEKALADYNKSIALDPANPKTYANRSSAKGMLGDYTGALEDANRSLEIKPGYENALSNRATAYLYLNKFEKAIDDYTRILEMDSTNTNMIRKRIIALEKTGQEENILNDYLALTRLEPYNYINFAKAGEYFYRLDQIQKSIEYLSKSMELKPDYHQPLFLRGNAFYKSGDYDNALSDFSRYAEITGQAVAYYNMGMSYKMLNQIPEACKAWKKAHELGHANAAKRLAESCR